MAEPPPGTADMSPQFQNQAWFPSLLIEKLLRLPFWHKYRGVAMVTEVRPPLQHSTEISIQVYDMPNAYMDLCGRASSFSACPKSVLISITYGSLHECVGVTVCPAGTRLSINSFPSERLAPSKPGRGGNS